MTASRHHHHHTASYSPLTSGDGGCSASSGPTTSKGNRLTQTLRSISWPQRKLFLLVFLWTCVCLVVFKTSLLSSSVGSGPPAQDAESGQPLDHNHYHHLKLAARSAASLKPTTLVGVRLASSSPTLEILAPENFDNLPSGGGENLKSFSPIQQSSQSNVIVSSSSSPSPSSSSSSSSSVSSALVQTSSASESGPPPPTLAVTRTGVSSDRTQARGVVKTKSDVNLKRRKSNERKHSSQPVGGDQCHYHYPNLFDLQFNNIHWQKFVSQANGEHYASFKANSNTNTNTTTTTTRERKSKPATYYLYNAYYDDRWRGGLPSVRVLAMIDRIHPPPTNCLLWTSKLTANNNNNNNNNRLQRPLVTRAEFVYAWYPKWGNYEDGLLQPWIVTCKLPRDHAGLVPESVSLVDVPAEVVHTENSYPEDHDTAQARSRRDLVSPSEAAEIMPPAYSSSSSSSSSSLSSSISSAAPLAASHDDDLSQATSPLVGSTSASFQTRSRQPTTTRTAYDCSALGPISNNLPVFNRRPAGGKREKFAVCVKGLDFPLDGPESRVSIRLVEWIEMLNLLGAKKIFLYELDVHENISKVLNYYQQRGLVELSPLTLPGNQPNLPEYQHLYLKQKLTSKRQNELIPYNDCLYRNLYSYEYLALLDIDEVIMPLKQGHTSWYDLMGDVEQMSLSEQNYSRASYNVRNVYFFDDLSGPLGTTQANTQPLISSSSTSSSSSDTLDEALNEILSPATGDALEDEQDESARPHRDSAERGIPHYLHMMSHVYRSKNYTEPGQYVKCFHNTERVVSLHNHFPMNCFGQCTTYSIPLDLAHLQHYRKDCVGPLRQSCKNDFRLFTTRDTTIWRYKQRMIRRTTRVLNHLQLLGAQQPRQTSK